MRHKIGYIYGICFWFANSDSDYSTFSIQIWLIDDTERVLHRAVQLSFPQNKRAHAFFHRQSLQERGEKAFTVNADLM